MKTFNIAGLFKFDDYILKFLNHRKDIIVYGSINCLWAGGRSCDSKFTIDQIRELVNIYNHFGIGCRFTFTNSKITKNDLTDDLCNQILDIFASNSLNGIILESDILYNYIKQKYPNLCLVASVIKVCNESNNWKDLSVEYYDNLCERFDYVVICQSHNFDNDILSKLKYKDKVELLVNSRCIRFCPFAKNHYKLIAEHIQNDINGINDEKNKTDLETINATCTFFHFKRNNVTCFTENERIDELVAMGFNNFKLEGRDQELITYVNDLKYFIKPTL